MSVELIIWLGLTIFAWGVFSFAVKCSTLYFQHMEHGVRNTLVYQPLGFVAAAFSYSYVTLLFCHLGQHELFSRHWEQDDAHDLRRL